MVTAKKQWDYDQTKDTLVATGRGVPGDVVSGSGPLNKPTRPTGKALDDIKDALKNIKDANKPQKGRVSLKRLTRNNRTQPLRTFIFYPNASKQIRN